MSRTGSAVALPLALLALALLLPLLVARHAQGSHARSNVARSVRGALLTDLARAAVAEAWWQLERASLDSSDRLYIVLRGGASAAQNFTIDVPHLTKLLADDPTLAGCTLVDGNVKATLSPRTATSPRTREGISDVKLEARFVHAIGGSRIVRETREMRLALIALPPPFDQPSVIVLDALPLVGEQTNGWMEEAVSTVNQIVNGIKGAGGSTVGEIPPPLVDDLDKQIYRFPSKYVVKSTQAQIPDLSRIFLWPRIEAAHKRVEAAGPPDGLQAQAQSDPSGASKKAGTIAQAHNSLLDEARAYQKMWEAVGGKDADQLNALAGQLAPTEWRRRAFLAFDGAGCGQRFLDLVDTYGREDPPRGVSGVVYINNGEEPLKLRNRTFRGRLVICATGPVDLEEVKLSNAQTDLLVVQAEGPMTGRGRMESSLVAHGGIQLTADAVLAGSLVVDHVRAGDRYGGKVDLDFSRLHVTNAEGMDRPEMFRIAFAPLVSSRELITE